MALKIANNAVAEVTSIVQIGDSSVTVDSLAPFPTIVPNVDHYYVTLSNLANTEWEVVKVRAIYETNNVKRLLLDGRGLEGTTAQVWPYGSVVSLRLTAGVLSEYVEQETASMQADIDAKEAKGTAVAMAIALG